MRVWLAKGRLLFFFLLLAAFATAAQDRPPARPFDGWKSTSGTWRAKGDVYAQSDTIADCRAFAEPATWTDYVYEVKARKLGGAEGFLVLFRVKDTNHFYWWNIGGWANASHALETRPRGSGFPSVRGGVETGKWYDVKIVVQGPSIKCYLDGKLIHDVKNTTYDAGGIGLGSWATQVEYKDVSVTALDGRKLYGADRIQLAEGALLELGTAGEALRKEYDALRQANVPAEDPRWLALYQKTTALCDAFREGKENLKQIDLQAPRAAIQDFLGTLPRVSNPREGKMAEELLTRFPALEAKLNAMKSAVAAGQPPDLRGVGEVQSFLKEVTDFHLSLYVPRCPPIAFIRRRSHGLRGTNATMHAHGTDVGSAISTYDPAHPENGAKTIFEDKDGFIMDMSPSYDARKLIFTYKKEIQKRQDSHHVYEINVDGTGMKQLTSGRYHDFNPVYLPDGRICFASTRVESFSLCQDFLACALYIADADGSNIRRLEYSTLCDMTPSVMDDGSILYTRWEYQDKNIFCTEALWTINPDGSRIQLFYGNTLTVPNAIYGAKQIPGTKKVLCTMAAHHFPPLGAIGIIDRRVGHENAAGIVNITPEVPYVPAVGRTWRDTNWGPGDVFFPWSYADPCPIAADLFLVSYGGPLQGGPQRYRLCLLDDKGHKVPLYEESAASLFCPVPLRQRPLPHLYPGAVPPEARGEGRYFVLNVYEGLLQYGVRRGQVRWLRIMCQLPKKYNTEGPRYSDHYPAIGEGTYYVKYVYGTVPVDENGMAYFTAPAGVELYFQALDEHGKEIRRMGTVTQLRDGETQGCIGCHESRSSTPPISLPPAGFTPAGGYTLAAPPAGFNPAGGYSPAPPPAGFTPAGGYSLDPLQRRLAQGPDRIIPPPWGEGPVDFCKQVQPVLDRHCAKCHSGPRPEGGIDLSGDKTRLFNMAFETLVFTPGLVERYHINPGPTGNFPALATGSWTSRLTKLIEEKHQKADIDEEGRWRIYTWIDANVPYYGTWDMTRPHTFGGRDTWLGVGGKPLPWFEAFEKAYAETLPPAKEAKETKEIQGGRRSRAAQVGHADINLTHPEWSRVLTRNLAKSAGGLADDAKALFKSADDPRYRAILKAIEEGKAALLAKPRMDMPGAVPIPQERDFGRTF